MLNPTTTTHNGMRHTLAEEPKHSEHVAISDGHKLRFHLRAIGDQLDKILAISLASQALYTESGRISSEFHLLELIEHLASDAYAFNEANDMLDNLEKRLENSLGRGHE